MKKSTLIKLSPIVLALAAIATTANGFTSNLTPSSKDEIVVEPIDESGLAEEEGGGLSFYAAGANTTCQNTVACTKVPAVTVDVLVLFDDKTAAKYNNNFATVAKSWENQINSYYANSGIGLKLRVVATQKYVPTKQTFDGMLPEIQQSASIANQRQTVGADFVTFVQGTDRGYCGVGYTAVNKGVAFNVINESCGSLTMAHELGHNMGLNHSRKQGNTKGVRYDYGLGHGVQGQFSTIMGYPSAFGTGNRMGIFSNPTLKCQGYACGVPVGQAEQAYAVLALNNVRTELRDFMPTKR